MTCILASLWSRNKLVHMQQYVQSQLLEVFLEASFAHLEQFGEKYQASKQTYGELYPALLLFKAKTTSASAKLSVTISVVPVRGDVNEERPGTILVTDLREYGIH